jgi:hypothetical protein
VPKTGIERWRDGRIHLVRGTIEGQERLAERREMEQLMEKPVEMLKPGPRHAKPVTLKGRLIWALGKGPARWSWKTYMAAMAIVVVFLVFMGVAMAVGMIVILSSFQK